MGNVRRAAWATSALALTTVMAGAGAATAAQPAAVPTVESTTERVLQSVDVSMGPDGTTTGVGSSVVRTEGSVEDAETSDETYAPQDVVGDLPVRVLTSWRTSEGAGTDLADLQGYTGRIAIDLTVQNLTVKPDVLTYDAAGASRQQAALVGSPLTVTASTALGDLKPARVVTDDKGSGVNVTNGIIGEDSDGTTVQWAALLAPPVLSSATEMSLVVDAKDFDVPTFDLSVQPGLVTDPSIGALVDSAFNPANSDELDLQRRTIELITDVNVVLAKASDTISDVRTSLTDSAETLGTQTVSDLQSSTESVTGNMQALDGQLESLRGELSSTLESTGSSAIAEMQAAVDTVDQMLGDTSAQPQPAQVRGTGCETSVADPKQAGSVYGSLLQVAGQLDGYAEATEKCKVAVKDSILTNIGPADPTPESCAGSSSVTCLLLDAEETFDTIADDLNSLTDTALELLTPGRYQDAIDALTALQGTISAITTKTGYIVEGRNGVVGSMNDAVYGPDRQPGGAPGQLETLAAQIDAAQSALATLEEDAGELGNRLASMQTQSQRAAETLCQLVNDGAITDDQAKPTLAYLVGQSCTGQELNPPDSDGDGTPDFPAGVAERLMPGSDDLQHLDRIQSSAGTASASLETIGSGVDGVYTALKDALDQRYGGADDGITFSVLIDQLHALSEDLNEQNQPLADALDRLQEDSDDVADINTEIDQKINEAKDLLGQMLDDQAQAVSGAGTNASDELGAMLERSSSGLSSSSDAVVQNGRKSLDGLERDFAQAQEAAGNRVTDTIEKGLSQIDSGVTSSTRDMEAATTLLVGDLRTVLLDLGERREGGGGLLGAMATNAATARTADYQLGLAGDKTTSYANVRGRDIDGLMLRQAQTDAAMQMLVDMPAFRLDLPSGSQHRTVYSFRIGDS